MKCDTGRCLLPERLADVRTTVEELAERLHTKPALLHDYIEGKRIMPLRNAMAIARALSCKVEDLYEWVPREPAIHQ